MHRLDTLISNAELHTDRRKLYVSFVLYIYYTFQIKLIDRVPKFVLGRESSVLVLNAWVLHARDSITGKIRGLFSLWPHIQNRIRCHPASYTVGNVDSFHES